MPTKGGSCAACELKDECARQPWRDDDCCKSKKLKHSIDDMVKDVGVPTFKHSEDEH